MHAPMELLLKLAVRPACACGSFCVARPSRSVVRFYNQRGTAEQWIKEDPQAVKRNRLQPREPVAAAGVAAAD